MTARVQLRQKMADGVPTVAPDKERIYQANGYGSSAMAHFNESHRQEGKMKGNYFCNVRSPPDSTTSPTILSIAVCRFAELD
jgi:hypothetical protein